MIGQRTAEQASRKVGMGLSASEAAGRAKISLDENAMYRQPGNPGALAAG